MTRLAETSPLETLSLVMLALGFAVLGALLAVAVALAGLGRLPDMDDLLPALTWLHAHRAEPLVRRWLWLGALAGVLPLTLLPPFAASLKPALFGKARFANEAEVRRGGLRARAGLVIGRRGGELLVFGGEEHLLLYAPTRSGKGVGVVIPNLLNWPGSLVVLDIKRENWAASAGFRAAHGQAVFCFDPLDPDGRTHRYNPLGHVPREDPAAVLDELQRIATMLFPVPERADPFWAESARTGFIGVGALVATRVETTFSFGEIYRTLARPDLRGELAALLSDPDSDLPVGARTALADFCGASDNTFAGVRQTITSRLSLWLNPHVDAATQASDFDLREVRRRPMSLYLCASLDNLERVAPLYGLLFQQLIDLNTRSLPQPGRDQIQALFLLDEFARLGRANVLAHAFSYAAGYGLRLLPVLQSPAQLRAAYGADLAEDIIANCGAEVVFAPKDLKIAQELSERLGSYTYEARSRSRPIGLSRGTRSLTLADQRRPLMLPQELMQMSPRRLLVFRAGLPPISGRKLRYYREDAFLRRVRSPPDLPQHLPKQGPPAAGFPSTTRAMTAAEAHGRDPLTLEMVLPTLDAAGLHPLPSDASEVEILAWTHRLIDAGLARDPP